MNRPRDASERHERLIAGLLRYGTWIATAVVGAGLAAALSGHHGLIVAKAGIALFILLPVTRVALMLALFVREKDYTYTAIAAVVLGIIAAGVAAGL